MILTCDEAVSMPDHFLIEGSPARIGAALREFVGEVS
jgi:hypothetical protein